MSVLLGSVSQFFLQNTWLIHALIVLLIGAGVSWVESTVYQRLLPPVKKTKRVWDSALLDALHKPVQFLIWAYVGIVILHIVLAQLGLNAASVFKQLHLQSLFFIGNLLWFILRFIDFLEQGLLAQPHDQQKGLARDKTTLRAVTQLTRVSSIVVCLLVTFQTYGISIATLLAVGGVGGIALGFAARDTLANFLGGMMVFWDRPFSVGDWVRSPDRQIEGTVEHIGWRLTRIRTFDKRPLYVPNGLFSNISIENPSRMLNRRIKTTIGLRYKDASKMAVILADIEKMLRSHPEIDTRQTLMVNLFEFGDSSLNFFIYTFTKTTDWVRFQAIQQDVLLKVIDVITGHGAECAFPTRTLDIPPDAALPRG